MNVHVLTGTKSEIVEAVARIDGDIREVLVFVEEPADAVPISPSEDIFAEMEPYTVSVGWADDSREGIYTRMEGE